MADQDDVRRIALALPQTAESRDHLPNVERARREELIADAWRIQAPAALVKQWSARR